MKLGITRLSGVVAIAAVFAAIGAMTLVAAPQNERRISFYNIHTKDTIDVVYMRNGRRIPQAMKKINWVLRDWRQDKATTMDPKLIDVLWEVHRELGSREPIHVISGYRSAKTNSMLRKTRGGQAKKSRHILGKAADVHFPDIPVKKLRYSALIRERGGVGYYPTSAIPFVHIDTGRVRHWPRMPRQELALLFPDGKTKHRPARGGPITKRDVRTARVKYASLANEISGFHQFRRAPKPPRPTLLAENAGPTIPSFSTTMVREPRIAARPKAKPLRRVASLGPSKLSPVRLDAMRRETAPALVAKPQIVDRPKPLRRGPSERDREQLTDLFTLASFIPFSNLFTSKKPADDGSADKTPPPAPITQAEPAQPEQQTARLSIPTHAAMTSGGRSPERFQFMAPTTTGWVAAPEYDEEHPDELYYRPFPVAPMLTASSSADDPALATMVHPDVEATLELLNNEGTVLPMRFAPRRQVAEALWAQQHFTGQAVGSDAMGQRHEAPSSEGSLTRRQVRTSMR